MCRYGTKIHVFSLLPGEIFIPWGRLGEFLCIVILLVLKMQKKNYVKSVGLVVKSLFLFYLPAEVAMDN
jgi:hypothetical protein